MTRHPEKSLFSLGRTAVFLPHECLFLGRGWQSQQWPHSAADGPRALILLSTCTGEAGAGGYLKFKVTYEMMHGMEWDERPWGKLYQQLHSSAYFWVPCCCANVWWWCVETNTASGFSCSSNVAETESALLLRSWQFTLETISYRVVQKIRESLSLPSKIR